MQPSSGADLPGLNLSGPSHSNCTVPELVEFSLQRREGSLSIEGALVALTGERTGRSPGDKFIVREPTSQDRIAWGKLNQPLNPESFQRLKARVTEHFKTRESF